MTDFWVEVAWAAVREAAWAGVGIVAAWVAGVAQAAVPAFCTPVPGWHF